MSLFSHDSAVWRSGTDLHVLNREMQKYFDEVLKFFAVWGFKISKPETVAVVFTRSNWKDDSGILANRCNAGAFREIGQTSGSDP